MTGGWDIDVFGISLDVWWHMRSMEVMILGNYIINILLDSTGISWIISGLWLTNFGLNNGMKPPRMRLVFVINMTGLWFETCLAFNMTTFLVRWLSASFDWEDWLGWVFHLFSIAKVALSMVTTGPAPSDQGDPEGDPFGTEDQFPCLPGHVARSVWWRGRKVPDCHRQTDRWWGMAFFSSSRINKLCMKYVCEFRTQILPTTWTSLNRCNLF